MEQLYYLCAKALFLGFGLWQGLQLPEHKKLVLSLFLALALSFAAPLFRRKILQAIPLVLGCLLPLLYPEALGFLPLFLFDIVSLEVYPAALPGLLACIRQQPGGPLLLYVAGGSLLAALLAWVLRENASLRRALRHVRDEAGESVLAYKAEQKALSEKQDAEVYAATLTERNRIAREIHDNVGHMLSRSLLMTGALKTVHRDDAPLRDQLDRLDQSLSQAMTAIRESVHDLYDDSVDLKQSAAALAAGFSFCPVALDCRITSAAPRRITYCFLAIIKEALVNIRKHSHATQAQIAITEHPALWQMIIQDNGGGSGPFPQGNALADPSFSAQQGLGLKNMRERVEQLSGTIHFSQADGFRIFISIPKEAL